MLLLILTVVLLSALIISKNKKKVLTYLCWGISAIFFFISLRYYYDVYIYNPTSEGFVLTNSMYFLTHNEDFLSRNGKNFGLLWGGRITIVSFFLGMIYRIHSGTKEHVELFGLYV